MKYYEENSAAMSEDDNLDVESDVSVIIIELKEFFPKKLSNTKNYHIRPS